MQTRQLIVALALSLFAGIAAAQPALDERIHIKLRINGQVMQGAHELADRTTGLSSQDVARVLDSVPAIPVRSGQTIRLLVTVTEADGTTRNLSGSPRLRYESFGCLTVSPLGVVTVTPMQGVRCALPAFPELWIIYTDAVGNELSFNAYQFRVTDRPL